MPIRPDDGDNRRVFADAGSEQRLDLISRDLFAVKKVDASPAKRNNDFPSALGRSRDRRKAYRSKSKSGKTQRAASEGGHGVGSLPR